MIKQRVASLAVKSEFGRRVSITLVAQVLGLAATVASSAIVARWLGVEGKGIVALAMLVPTLLGLFLGGGIEVANVYLAGSQKLDVSALASNSVALAILSTCVGVCLVGLLGAIRWLEILVPGVPLVLFGVAMIGLPMSMLTSHLGSVLTGAQKIGWTNLVNLTRSAGGLLLTILFVVGLRWGVVGALVASLLSVTGALVLASVFIYQLGGSLRPRWNKSVMRVTLGFGLRGYIGNVLQFFNYRLDMFVVNFFLGSAGVGIYTVSVALAELLWHLPNAVGFVILPMAASTEPGKMNEFTPRVFKAILGLTAVGAVGIAVIGRPLITLIYTRAFDAAFFPLLALLPGVVLLGSAKVLTNEITGRGYPHYNSINSGIGLILTVSLDWLLIPRYGVLGAAIASSAAYTVIFVMAVFFYRLVSRKTVAHLEVS